MTDPTPLSRLQAIEEEKARLTEEITAQIPDMLQALAGACHIAGPRTRKELIDLGIISKRDDETVKRARKPRAVAAAEGAA